MIHLGSTKVESCGVGPLRRGDGLWDELLEASWDGNVKIHILLCLAILTLEMVDSLISSSNRTNSHCPAIWDNDSAEVAFLTRCLILAICELKFEVGTA